MRLFNKINLKSHPSVWDLKLLRSYLAVKESSQGYIEADVQVCFKNRPNLKVLAVLDSLSDISFINPNLLKLTKNSPEFVKQGELPLKTVNGINVVKFDIYNLGVQLRADKPPVFVEFHTLDSFPAQNQAIIIGNDFRKAANLKITISEGDDPVQNRLRVRESISNYIK